VGTKRGSQQKRVGVGSTRGVIDSSLGLLQRTVENGTVGTRGSQEKGWGWFLSMDRLTPTVDFPSNKRIGIR